MHPESSENSRLTDFAKALFGTFAEAKDRPAIVARGDVQKRFTRKSDILQCGFTHYLDGCYRGGLILFHPPTLSSLALKIVSLGYYGRKDIDRWMLINIHIGVVKEVPGELHQAHRLAKSLSGSASSKEERFILSALHEQYLGVAVDLLAQTASVTPEKIVEIIEGINKTILKDTAMSITRRSGIAMITTDAFDNPVIVDNEENREKFLRQSDEMPKLWEERIPEICCDTSAQIGKTLEEEDDDEEEAEETEEGSRSAIAGPSTGARRVRILNLQKLERIVLDTYRNDQGNFPDGLIGEDEWRAIHDRPKTRGDCLDGPRPCVFVGCQHNLYLDVNKKTGSMALSFPDLSPWEMKESCALDVADRGGLILEEVGDILDLTRERIRQLEEQALAKLRAAVEDMGLEEGDVLYFFRRR
jgi:hypothetical protein